MSGPVAAVNATRDLFRNAVVAPRGDAFARKVGGVWRRVRWEEFADQVRAVAAGLVAAGVEPAARVAVFAGTSFEWVLCDFAIWTAGAVSVPIYETSSPAQIALILDETKAVAAFVGRPASRSVLQQAAPPCLRQIWPMDDGGLKDLMAAGSGISVAAVEHRRRAASAAHTATIVYTSGTTGRPKGCVLTHTNLVAMVDSVTSADGVRRYLLNDRSSMLLFLPLAHVLARVVQLAAVRNRAVTAHLHDLRQVTGELAAFQPTLLLGVPRVFEKLYNTARQTARAQGHGGLFQAAEDTAIAYSYALDRASNGGGPGLGLRLRRCVFGLLVYRKLRAVLGGRASWAVSGGAPLTPRLGHFLRGCGIPVLEGYGLTETSAGLTLNLPDAHRIGTVGRALPGCTVRIADDGEVLAKGSNVFSGYLHDVDATRQAFDPRGWLRTGDLGELDSDGYLAITGRKKDLIVTATGKNVAPAFFEDRLRAHALIDQCVVVGDRRPYVSALIAVDPGAVTAWQRETGRVPTADPAEYGHDTELVWEIQHAVDEVNHEVSSAEAIKRFRIVAGPFRINDELTPTRKLRREHALAKYASDVEDLYTSQ